MPTVYRQHRCAGTHGSFHAMAKCVWPSAAWIHGNGPIAVVAYCSGTTISLHKSLEDGLGAKQWIDRHECGADCTLEHELIQLALPR